MSAPARQTERFSSVRLPHATRDGGKAEMETRSGRTHRSACSASLALYTSSARDNPDRSSVTFVRLIVRDRRETPHSTPARVLVAQLLIRLPETSRCFADGENFFVASRARNKPRISSRETEHKFPVLLTRRAPRRFFACLVFFPDQRSLRGVDGETVFRVRRRRFARHFSRRALGHRDTPPPWSSVSFCSPG